MGILEVKSVGLLDGEPSPAAADSQYTKPNALVTSQDSRVRSLALRVTRGVVDPWQKADRINHFVFDINQGQEFRGRIRRSERSRP